MEDWISNYTCDKEKMNFSKPVTAEDTSTELTYLHEKFTFVPEDLET